MTVQTERGEIGTRLFAGKIGKSVLNQLLQKFTGFDVYMVGLSAEQMHRKLEQIGAQV